jgi:hypothetical protein
MVGFNGGFSKAILPRSCERPHKPPLNRPKKPAAFPNGLFIVDTDLVYHAERSYGIENTPFMASVKPLSNLCHCQVNGMGIKLLDDE